MGSTDAFRLKAEATLFHIQLRKPRYFIVPYIAEATFHIRGFRRRAPQQRGFRPSGGRLSDGTHFCSHGFRFQAEASTSTPARA